MSNGQSQFQIATPDNVSAQLAAYHAIAETHRAWDSAADLLRSTTGVPLCAEHCGRCCEVNVPVAVDLEADYAVSHLLGLSANLRESILSTLEGWLTEFDPGRGIVTPVGRPITPGQQVLEGEVLQASRCPLLDSEKRCLAYEARPMVCRAYGVTLVPLPYCQRPHVVGSPVQGNLYCLDGPSLQPLVPFVGRLVQACQSRPRAGFFPTLVYAKLRSARFKELWEDGKIPLVKVSTGRVSRPGPLFEMERRRAPITTPAPGSVVLPATGA